MGGATSMNTSESINVLSDVLLEDERIVSLDEREFLADLLRHSENNPNESTPEVTRAIARIAGEIVVQRAGSLVGDSILRKLTEQSQPGYGQHRRADPRFTDARSYISSLPPKPPSPTPPNPGPGGYRTTVRNLMSSLPPKPPSPTPPNPGPGTGMRATVGPKGILNLA